MNFSFSRRTDLALAAMDALSQAPNGKRTRAELATATGTTPSFLPQVMGPLVKVGWVDSGRGPGGGYRLSETAPEATLLELIELFEGPTHNGRCVLKEGRCPDSACLVHELWVEARRILVDGFDEVPILQTKAQGGTT
jgi:Rrf2 family protein